MPQITDELLKKSESKINKSSRIIKEKTKTFVVKPYRPWDLHGSGKKEHSAINHTNHTSNLLEDKNKVTPQDSKRNIFQDTNVIRDSKFDCLHNYTTHTKHTIEKQQNIIPKKTTKRLQKDYG